jgi:ribonucleoside-diphosphate reductase alpha chain
MNFPYLARIYEELDEEYQEKWRKYGRRNIALSTTAPVGSKSCETQTTSGFEAAFLLAYTRRRKVSPHHDKIDFVDELGDCWEEYPVYHHGLKRWMDVTGETNITKSPYHGATSNDLDWVKSVDMQAAAQKWVCHAISRTVNLPSDVSKGVVSAVYMRAWEKGCKGITVYRDGSRSGVLISKDDEGVQNELAEGFVQHDALKRPQDVPCEIHRASVKGEQYVIIIGVVDGKPYEIFGGKSDQLELPKKCTSGILRKHSFKTVRSKYDLLSNDESLLVKDIVAEFDNDAYATYTRLVSLSLRHGAKVSYVVEQLMKDPDPSFISFAKVVSRVLKKYIQDGTEASSVRFEECPQPGAGGCNIVYQEGCLTCLQCGFAKCG